MCRALKADPELDFIPVILLTAKASQESKIEGLERGADAYVTKPFSVREIEVRVRQLIAQRQRLKTRLQAAARGRGSLQTDASALPASPEETFLAQVRSVIDSCVSEEDFGVDELAEAMAMSRSTLYRRLGDLDHSPMDMIWEVRLSHAVSLLQEEAGNVSEVAYAVGFKSVSHFGRRFRALYGVSPSAYAAQHAE